jgi:cob(I)alamin adenosyltransferase
VIQNELFNIGSILGAEKSETLKMLPAISEANIQRLELEIDKMSELLPPLKNFILPTGHHIASHLHVARTMCRRAERRSVEIQSDEQLHKNSLIYLNRLSDHLFIAARWVNITQQSPEVLWAKISN